MSIKRIVETNVWNEATGQWEQPYQKTAAQVVETSDGSNVQAKLDALPAQITAAHDNAVSEVLGGVADGGNTLAKVYALITALQALVRSDDVSLDTVQEIVSYIKTNASDLTLMGTSKVGYADIVNGLTTAITIEKKTLDARQGKVLKDLIDALTTNVTSLQTQAQTFATETQLTEGLASVSASARMIISETAPASPVDGQVWLKPAGSITIN